MKKYISISLLFHLSFFLIFKINKQLRNENLNKVVPISFVETKSPLPPASSVVVPKETEKKEVVKYEPKKEEKKIEKIDKKEIKSKVADKEEKKVEEKSIEEIATINEPQQLEATETITTDGGGINNSSSETTVFSSSNFKSDGDGSYVALTSAGINYEILNEVEPDYPLQAERIGYSQKVTVTVKFLVGLKGQVEQIEIIKSHQKLGFDDEVKKAIKKWRFKPIYHHGENIKVYFEKDFIFNPPK